MKRSPSDQCPPLTLADIESEKIGIFRVYFTPLIEALYRVDTIDSQHKSIALTWLVGIALYDSFLLSDYFLAGDKFYIYLICRITITTPACLVAIRCIYMKSKYYDFWMCVVPVAMSVCLSYLLIMTNGSFRASYLFGDILLMMCAAVISRHRVGFTIATIAVQSLCFQSVLVFSDAIAPRDRVVSVLFSLSGGMVSIMTAYVLERTSRHAYLLGLRVRLLNAELEVMAKTDALTGLGNRRIFEETLQRIWSDRLRSFDTASIILIDIDHFKSFNDNYGHPAGDVCLQIIARCVKEALRDERDLGVRFGGEELLVLLLDTDFISAREMAETIRRAILAAKVPHPAIGEDVFVTASFGVATAPVNDCPALELVSRADIALYSAKRNGRNQIWPPFDACSGSPALSAPCYRREVVAPLEPPTKVTTFAMRSA